MVIYNFKNMCKYFIFIAINWYLKIYKNVIELWILVYVSTIYYLTLTFKGTTLYKNII